MTSNAKPGAEYRSIVIRYRPVQRLMLICGLVLFILLVAAVAFRLGGAVRESNYQQLLEQKAGLTDVVAESHKAVRTSEQALANAEMAIKVDRLALEELRQSIKTLQDKIAELSEENTFYKGLMAPTELERGLSLRGWNVSSLPEPRHFHFKLVVQQLALKHRLLYGTVKVSLLGQQDGKARTLSLHNLSEQLNNEHIKLRFKYFQTVEGELLLPEGFRPKQVQVVVKATKPKAATVEKSYGWVVQ
jgi:hypothetical protein